MAPEVLPDETLIIPDVVPRIADLIRKARLWAAVPHRYFVDEFFYQAKKLGYDDNNEMWAVYEILQKAENKQEVPNVPVPSPSPRPAKRRRTRAGGDGA